MSFSTIIAVASGKGGVGKTLTSINLALNAARTGHRVALVDADPLSNVMAALDYPVPSRPLPLELTDPSDHAFIAAPRFEVLFPQAKVSANHASSLVGSLLENHRDWLARRYSLVLIDLPAGADADKLFPYLKLVDSLLLVTNPEPTAHVAAGTLIKNLECCWKSRDIFLWHNRYEAHPDEIFDPDDVLGNYNRNVPEQEKISHSVKLLPIAFIPPDPALNLIKSDPPLLVNLYQAVSDTLEALAESALPPLPPSGLSGSRSAALIRYFLRSPESAGDPEAGLVRLEAFLQEELSDNTGEILPASLRSELKAWLNNAGNAPMRYQSLKVKEVVNLYIGKLDTGDATGINARAVDRELVPLLKSLACLPTNSRLSKMASLLLFRYCLLKLFTSETASKVISSFLPRRMENGIAVRDRRTQIARLIGKDTAYQTRYFALIKKLYPLVSRQLDHLVNSFGLHGLLFRNPDGSPARTAYLKLFSATMYEILNSGLGIVAGFRFRPSSRAFQTGYDRLIRSAHLAHPPSDFI